MDISPDILQAQDNKVYSYFKTTTEPFDFLEWDGKTLKVWSDDSIVEIYQQQDLEELIFL